MTTTIINAERTNEIIANNPEFIDLRAAFENNAHTWVNEHNDKTEKFAGVALLNSGEVVGLADGKTIFCLNAVALIDDKIHLSTCSVAGNLDTRKNETLDAAISEYNQDIMDVEEKYRHLYTDNLIVAYFAA